MIDDFPRFRDQLCAECGKPITDDEAHVIDEDSFHEDCCPMCGPPPGPRKHQWAHDVASIVGLAIGAAALAFGVIVLVAVIEAAF